MAPNVFLLAADNDPTLLPHLRANPTLASSQDQSGYSLIHAAASYNHLDLLRTLVTELGVSADLRDEDGETALFVVETVEAARVLVEELGADITVKSNESESTARQRIEEEGDYPEVAAYLREIEVKRGIEIGPLPKNDALPEGMAITVETMDGDEGLPEVDPEFRRRIEQLAERADFDSVSGQEELRKLVEDALSQQSEESRNVRQRTG